MGATGVYVSGNGLLELQAAVVIASKDPARSRAAVAKLAAAYRRDGRLSPTSISIPGTDEAAIRQAQRLPAGADDRGRPGQVRDRLRPGLGAGSAQPPERRWPDASSYTAATSALGQGAQPSVLVEFPTLVGLIETRRPGPGTGISTLLPYLQALTTLDRGTCAASRGGYGVMRSRVAVLGLSRLGLSCGAQRRGRFSVSMITRQGRLASR